MTLRLFLELLAGLGKISIFLSFWFLAAEFIPDKLLVYVRRGIKVLSGVLAGGVFVLIAWSGVTAKQEKHGEVNFPTDTDSPFKNGMASIYNGVGRAAPLLDGVAPFAGGMCLAVLTFFSLRLGLTRLLLGGDHAPNWKDRKFKLGVYLFVVGSALDFLSWFGTTFLV